MKNFQNRTNIARVSRIIRNILFAGLALEIIGIPVAVLAPLPAWNRGLSPSGRYLAFGLLLLIVLCLIVTLNLFRFFDRLKKGHLFDAQTVGYLDASGRWWIALWFFQVLFYAIGHQYFQITNAVDIFDGQLFAGLTLIFMAWLLKEAQGLQEEQALTV